MLRTVPDSGLFRESPHSCFSHADPVTFCFDSNPSNWNSGVKSSQPATFNPTKLNIDNWAESMHALGAKHAVLTAKHGCGHLLWPTKVTLPDGRPYSYSVATEASAIKLDVLDLFSKTMTRNGIGHGFYYSLTNNYYLNVASHHVSNRTLLPGQEKVTQAQFEDIAMAQVNELWSDYGNLTEIWFDGGYSTDLKKNITSLLAAKQPQAAGFGGEGVTPNPVCWVGTESGAPGGDVWSTGTSGRGDPNSSDYCPKACDTTLQESDHWFWMGNPIRSLGELIPIYHGTVGRNGMLELDFAIDRQGLVDPTLLLPYMDV